MITEPEERQAWLAARPQVIGQARERWSLTIGEPFPPGGQTAWVAPARDGAGAALVLKVGWPHPEAAHEADGLRAWAGSGAVRLYAAHDFGPARALLLERCRPGTELSARPEPEQDTVIATLLRRLWIQPGSGHPFASLDQMCQRWADRSERILAAGQRQQPALAALDPGLVRAGLALFRELPATADRQVLLATDLHAGNVLAAAREPWLVIDPKPHVGDPAYDPLQHMLNCDDRLRSDPRGLARRIAGLLGLDPDRVLRWLFARCVQESADCPALAEVARQIAPAAVLRADGVRTNSGVSVLAKPAGSGRMKQGPLHV
ncbi:MAG TPA: aminoglycoside phosphotransferase family protein [Streptosporangiaceae bacterium]|nr:aminoglycoside phosphotransferase family protein [Streptosporangiaceae bacterium]